MEPPIYVYTGYMYDTWLRYEYDVCDMYMAKGSLVRKHPRRQLSWSGFSTIMSTRSSCQPHHHVNHPSSSSWEVWQFGSVWIQGWKHPRARNLVFFPFCAQEAFFNFRKSSHLQPLEQPLAASSKIANSQPGHIFHRRIFNTLRWKAPEKFDYPPVEAEQVAVQVAALGKWLQVAALSFRLGDSRRLLMLRS